jgi:hypothetical protein
VSVITVLLIFPFCEAYQAGLSDAQLVFTFITATRTFTSSTNCSVKFVHELTDSVLLSMMACSFLQLPGPSRAAQGASKSITTSH